MVSEIFLVDILIPNKDPNTNTEIIACLSFFCLWAKLIYKRSSAKIAGWPNCLRERVLGQNKQKRQKSWHYKAWSNHCRQQCWISLFTFDLLCFFSLCGVYDMQSNLHQQRSESWLRANPPVGFHTVVPAVVCSYTVLPHFAHCLAQLQTFSWSLIKDDQFVTANTNPYLLYVWNCLWFLAKILY